MDIALCHRGHIRARIKTLCGRAAKIAGVGIAAPFELWNWAQEVGAPQAEMERWRDVDIRSEIANGISYPVFLQNDATSACGAELVFGAGQNYADFLYVFIGSFIGGGVVLNSALFSGKTGTAGAIGPLPVQGQDGNTVQLLKIASIFVLENMLRERGIDPRPLWFSRTSGSTSANRWKTGFKKPPPRWPRLLLPRPPL